MKVPVKVIDQDANIRGRDWPSDQAGESRSPSVGLNGLQRQAMREAEDAWGRLTIHILHSEQLPAPWALGVTSSMHGEGRTSTALGLARAVAVEALLPVAFVEADFTGKTVALDCGLPPTPGLIDHMVGGSPIRAGFRRSGLPNLTIIVSGERVTSSVSSRSGDLTTLLRRRLPELVSELKQEFRYLILDLPPLFADVNSEAMASSLDGVLLVVRAGLTPLEKLKSAGTLLASSKLVGVVHIGQPSAIPRRISQLVTG